MGRQIETADGVRLHVTDLGSGEPLVFLHGWPVDHRMFEYQYAALVGRGYRCLGIDLRGFGQSDRPWEGYSYDVMADDLRAVLETLDLDDVTLVGFSMGGAVAIRYLSRHANARVSSLILLGAAAPSLTKRPDFPHGLDRSAVDDIIARCRADRPAMVAEFGRTFFHQPVSPEFRRWFDSLGLAASSHATVKCAVELRDADLRPDLAKIAVPTLILHATYDQVCPFELGRALQTGIPGARLVPFDRGGHGFFYEERMLVNEEIVRFVASVGGQSGLQAA